MTLRWTAMLALLWGGWAGTAAAWPADPRPAWVPAGAPVYRFEEDVPITFRPDADSHLTLNHRWYLGEGDTSLRWDWDRPGASFEVRCPDGLPGAAAWARPATGTGVPGLRCTVAPVLAGWIYNEAADPALLAIEIRAGPDLLHLFFVSLDFTGWQAFRLPHAPGLPAAADTLRFVAPAAVPTGTLYLDEFTPRRDELTWQEAPPRATLWPTPASADLLAPPPGRRPPPTG